MRRDRIHARPSVAVSVLVLGAAVHALLCIPLFGRRGFPELPPIWLAMQWMWVPPVVLSAVWVPWSRRRGAWLIGYSLVAGYVVSWAQIMMVPSYKTPVGALLDMVFFAPVVLVGVFVIEAVSRGVLRGMRVFLPREPRCGACGYSLHGLSTPRCPECGRSFDPGWLMAETWPRPTPWRRRWVWLLSTVVVILAATYPFARQAWVTASLRSWGRQRAETDWRNGEAKWYVTMAEANAIPASQIDRFATYFASGKVEPRSGLLIEQMWPDWWHLMWEQAYRQHIAEMQRAAGRPLPFHMPPNAPPP